MKILDFGIYTPTTPFEPILLLSLVALIWISWSQSERFVRSAFIVSALAILLFVAKVWFADFKHFSILFGVFALFGIFIGATRYISFSKMKYVFASWIVLLAFGLWFFEIFKFIPFHKMHYINQPFRLYFSGYIAWAIFLVLSSAAVFFLPNRKRSFGLWIGILFMFVILLEGRPSTLGLTKYNDVLFWGTGVDKANSYGETELYVVVEKQDIERVKELLAAGANVNEPRTKVIGGASTPFEKAVLSNNYELFLLLADNGGNITKPNKDGNMPIHLASEPTVTELRIVKYLLDNGADISARDKGDDQPIHRAVKKGFNFKTREDVFNPELVKFLLENGADIESPAKFYSGERIYTPLALAVMKSNYEVVKALVELGANLNPNGLNCLKLAKDSRKNMARMGSETSKKSVERLDSIIEYLTSLTSDE